MEKITSEKNFMKVADFIAEYLSYKKVTHVFGVSGANIEDLFMSIHKKKDPIIVLAKNEYNAATMAIGYYLATRKITVVMTTSGPGVLNTIPVLAEAYTSKLPMVLIAGAVPETIEGLGAFQDTSGTGGSINILEMIKQVTCLQIKIKDEQSIPRSIEKAFAFAYLHKRPAVILIPKNIFNKEIDSSIFNMFDSILASNLCTDLSQAMNFCYDFSNFGKHPPLVILGEDLIHQKNIDFIKSFILKTGSFVALTPNSKGLFDNRHPRYLGLIGIMGHNFVNDYLEKTEHLILVGVNFDLLNRTGIHELMSSKKILIIKEEKSSSLFSFSDEQITEAYGDYEEIFSNIIPHCLPCKQKLPVEDKKTFEELSTDLDFNYKSIIGTIQSTINKDANIFVDAGNSGVFVIHHLLASGNKIFHISLGMGGMGNSIGAGIGSAIASNKKSYIFLGDGSFLMHGLELHTAMEYDLPVVFFIFNNNSHGMCSTRENFFLDGETGINNFRESKFAEGIGKLFPGIISHEVNNLDLLKQVLNDNIDNKSPCVLSINIDNSEAPPFKTFYKN